MIAFHPTCYRLLDEELSSGGADRTHARYVVIFYQRKDALMTLVRPTADDPLFRMADQIPLGRRLGLVTVTNEVPSEPDVRPFGLRYATSSVTPIPVDMPALCYDRRRQITVDDIGVPVFGKHSTGQTSTRTSDGHKSMDSDTDYTED